MNAPERAGLVAAVQSNCDIADARHATDMSLCIYLLQMRELHRWERGIALDCGLARSEVGPWIAERETLWATLEDQPFQPLPLGPHGEAVDPFDVATIDRHLRPAGLLYGAGLIGADRPIFFLAELATQDERDGLPVLTAGHELARGLVAPPAALARYSAQDTILIRRESLARWCWERFETFALRRAAGTPMHAVVQAYGLDRDFSDALPRWLDDVSETMVLHELGEHRAGLQLGPDWGAMRLQLPTRRGELHARALRDHLADLQFTLPTLLDRGADASIHFWFASYEGIREALFPSLKAGYAAWRHGDGGLALRQAAHLGAHHFAGLARRVLALHTSGGADAASAIEQLLTGPEAAFQV